MSKVQAEATGTLLFRNRSVAEEAAAFEDVLEIAERFSPRIEAVSGPLNSYAQAPSLSVSLLIDRTGTETLFGTAEQYARKLKSELEAAGFPSPTRPASPLSLMRVHGSSSTTSEPSQRRSSIASQWASTPPPFSLKTRSVTVSAYGQST